MIRSIINLFAPRALILLYHRVTELPTDPQLLCVSRKHFAEHLEVIRRLGRPTKLGGLNEVLQRGNRKPAVVVTFDDGYADNLHNARPLLERCDVPATVFVTSRHVKSGEEFWQDALDRIFLQPGHLPRTLDIVSHGKCYHWDLGALSHYDEDSHRQHRGWNVSRKDDPTPRHRVYRSLIEVLLPLADIERQKLLRNLSRWSGIDQTARPTHLPLTEAEVVRLADGGLIEVGCHTVNHPMLSRLPETEQAAEISENKTHLEDILAAPVTSFAYPYGGREHYTNKTVAAVRDAGFKRACSNFGGVVRTGTDPWQLPRFLVRDWSGDEFMRRISEEM
ncbi:MAG TPA: polysaccharide deacetylase family protein [Terriglobia bacterium]|nr:polysaccharide deacetylase family protein [Terriglobia bacterium]